ncbi:cache domain-containing protein [Patescibacteria group bacterium]|nr:cache domain-containing protein [Patescibacteria group bacterium]MBU0777297.1 cache domain-containing protein [Patescibacteria group bacterium]MBU0846274.1 cache domain-containing protein [Patescibacteria group bacterium]MBU0923177.1 cache domain-containing protein [Patescibacteria group bacterium]MBU1066891.1 cache domain-containing protein [Patescibacteria group bacterium]
MLLAQFLLVNTHFVLSLLAALVTFAVAWLYFDAWLNKKDFNEGYKFLGFLLLTVSFVIQATLIEQSLLEHSILESDVINTLRAAFRISGYLILIIGQIVVPLQPLPEYRKKKTKKISSAVSVLPFLGVTAIQLTSFSFPILAILTAFLYLRRATVGLENHLKAISLSFFILAFSELAGLAYLFRNTDNITVANIVAPFGPLWILERILLAASIFILGRWVWSYLLKRFETQLFMIFTTSVLTIFLLTTIFFTFASLSNLRRDILTSLKTDVGVLSYTIESKKAETLSDAQVIAQNTEIVSAVSESDRKKLSDLAVPILLAKKQASLVVVSDTGAVLMRAEEPERAGGSLSDNPLIKRALADKEVTSVVTKEGVIAPIVAVRAAVPVKSGEEVIGVVMVGSDIDNAFVDGVKEATGLDASVYADNIRSATTFVAPDGKSRWIGIKEETEEVKKTVLVDGEIYTGSVKLLNVPYFAAYAPLKNIDNNPVGMLFVGRPEVSILQTASRSIELTFITTAILLIISILPAYFVSKYIVGQIS